MSEPGTEAQAVALLNEAKLETDGTAKVTWVVRLRTAASTPPRLLEPTPGAHCQPQVHPAAPQVGKLRGLYELVVNKQPELLEEFLPEVAELQVDPSPHVRKYLPEFLAGAAQVSGARGGQDSPSASCCRRLEKKLAVTRPRSSQTCVCWPPRRRGRRLPCCSHAPSASANFWVTACRQQPSRQC